MDTHPTKPLPGLVYFVLGLVASVILVFALTALGLALGAVELAIVFGLCTGIAAMYSRRAHAR